VFFSKIGKIVGMECAYDFFEFVNCAYIFNDIAIIEYGENGFEFGTSSQQN
jgi:hypothetical protein